MPVYIIPTPKSAAPEFEATVKRAGGNIINVTRFYDFVRQADYNEIQFFPMDDMLVARLMRNLSDLTPEGQIPQIVFGVPGHAHTGRWATEVASLPPLEYSQVEPILLRSGVVSTNAKDATARSAGARNGANAPATYETTLSEQLRAKANSSKEPNASDTAEQQFLDDAADAGE